LQSENDLLKGEHGVGVSRPRLAWKPAILRGGLLLLPCMATKVAFVCSALLAGSSAYRDGSQGT
jgi:hypothetical protein